MRFVANRYLTLFLAGMATYLSIFFVSLFKKDDSQHLKTKRDKDNKKRDNTFVPIYKKVDKKRDHKKSSISSDGDDSSSFEFEELSVEELSLRVPYKKHVDPVAALKIDTKMLLDLKEGDSVSIEMLEQFFEFKLYSKHRLSRSKITTYDGISDQDGVSHHLIMTQGTHSLFISFTTDEGSFEGEIVDGEGYVYRTSDILYAYQSPNAKDTIRPKEAGF